jgi:hypothetical protein
MTAYLRDVLILLLGVVLPIVMLIVFAWQSLH